jgi:hypothetical protein
MAIKWLFILAVVVLLGSCGRESPSPAKEPLARPVDKPIKSPVEQAKKPAPPTVDQFGLPLIIIMETPEVPKEIRGPFRPIPEEPKQTAKP